MSLLNLSQELVVHIFSYLHFMDLNTCRRLSKPLNKLIQSSILLQYSMQLQLSGYEDNPSSPMAIIDKLKLLRQQENAWSRLDFEKQTSVRIPFNPSSIYDLTDGVLLLGESSSGRQSGADAIRWCKLSTLVSNPTQKHSWETIDVGAHVIDVGLSVREHDLIVVVTHRETDDHGTIFELRFVQLSTGLGHPLASKPVIQLVSIPSLPKAVVAHCSVCIQIMGDLLCSMFHYPSGPTTLPATFEVFNWKSGDCLQTRQINYATFTFLAPNIIALPNCENNTIELCRLGTSPDYHGAPMALQTACVLHLPRLNRGHSIIQITCRSEPKKTNLTHHAPAFRSTDPFHLNPKDAIVIFNVITHGVHGFHECLTLIVHSAFLLSVMSSPPVVAESPSPVYTPVLSESASAASALRIEGDSVAGPPHITWTQWGPRVCRWLETSFGASRWITTACGQRFVTVEEDPVEGDLTRSTIVVYDFNPHTVQRLAAMHRRRRRRLRGYWDVTLPEGELVTGSGNMMDTAEKMSGTGDTMLIPFTDPQTRVIGQIQCESTELMAAYAPEYKVFEEPIWTGLPYAQSSSFETYGYGAVLLDRNMVIGVKLNDADDIGELVIHTIRAGYPSLAS